jgi:hypothetical protein
MKNAAAPYLCLDEGYETEKKSLCGKAMDKDPKASLYACQHVETILFLLLPFPRAHFFLCGQPSQLSHA